MTGARLIARRYQLTGQIGTGAMGVVWRATDQLLGRTVAVKQVLMGPGLSPAAEQEGKRRAMREGRIAARLHHPNAVTIFDVVDEDDQPWLVMEYVNARSLAAVLADGRVLDPVEVARIGAKVADALAAAHDAGIVHRDVKPGNILIGDDGTVKLTDFGISRAVGDVTVTATGLMAGTPAYLAPEVARGEEPVPASDVFALGSTLYTAVEGRAPFGGTDNALAVLHAVARAQVDPPRRAGPLGPVLMDLLAAAAADRPTMRQAKAALEAVAAGRTPVISPTKTLAKPVPPPAPYVPPPAQPKRRMITVVGLVIASVLIAGGVVAAIVTTRGSGQESTISASSTASSSTTAPVTTTTTTTTHSAAGPLTFEQIAAFIRAYYGQLPSNVSSAWSELSPGYQAQTGGYAAYTAFWAGIRSVSVDAVTERDAKTGLATLTYTRIDGSVGTEQRWLRVESVNGYTYITGSGL